MLVISFLVFSVVSVHSLDFTEVIPVPQIDVTKPVEGEVLVFDDVYIIEWDSRSVPYVSITLGYTYQGG
ncbi:MAG: hypothetical protein ACW97P_13715, partial [Candidatus Hodarchaeales archaeon]